MEDDFEKFLSIECDHPREIVDWLQDMVDRDFYLIINSLKVIQMDSRFFAFIAVLNPPDKDERLARFLESLNEQSLDN